MKEVKQYKNGTAVKFNKEDTRCHYYEYTTTFHDLGQIPSADWFSNDHFKQFGIVRWCIDHAAEILNITFKLEDLPWEMDEVKE